MSLTPIDIDALPLVSSALLTDLLVVETADGTRSVQLQILRDSFAAEWSLLTNLPTTPPPTTPPPTTIFGGYILSVNGGQPGIAGTSGTGSYTPGTIVPIQAFLLPGWIFNAWSDDISYLTSNQFTNSNSVVQPSTNVVLTATASYTGTPPPTTPPPTTPPGGTLHEITLLSSNGTFEAGGASLNLSINVDLNSYGVSRIEYLRVTVFSFVGGVGGCGNGAHIGVSSNPGDSMSDHGSGCSAHTVATAGPIIKSGSNWIGDINSSGYSTNNGVTSGSNLAVNFGTGIVNTGGESGASGSGSGDVGVHMDIVIGYIS